MINLRTAFAALLALALMAAPPASAEGWYARLSGGANLHDAYEGGGAEAHVRLDLNSGYVAAAALGRTIDAVPGLRLEFEASFRTNRAKGLTEAREDKALSGHDSTFAVLVNAAYDVDLGLRVRPYLTIGAGYSARRISLDPTPDFWEYAGFGTERQGFAWATGLGATYDLNDHVSVGLGYRHFSGIAINRRLVYGGHETFLEASGDNDALIASVTVKLD